VTSTLYLTCGRCRQCLRGRETICELFGGHIGGEAPGGYAEYTLVPAENLVALPESIPFPQGSVLANALGTPYHALVKRMRLLPGERVVITGAGGGVGIHAVQIARMVGARVMAVDLSPDKLAAAEANGAELTVDPRTVSLRDAILEWTRGLGAEGVLELVGPATMTDTLVALGRGGRMVGMVVVGSQTGRELTIDPMELFRNEWELLGSRNCTKLELREVTDLVAPGRLHPVVSEVHPLEEAEQLHERQRAHDIVGRAVLEP
jgi:D-arabinose 1-dehydrogenase-like Zn-dependent alcohol dehydrogenase